MLQTCTQHDLIRFIYQETSQAENAVIKDVLSADFAFREAYDEMLQAYHQLPNVAFRPAKQSINNILAYSAATANR